MLKKKIINRITIDEIYEHPWLLGKKLKKSSMFEKIEEEDSDDPKRRRIMFNTKIYR